MKTRIFIFIIILAMLVACIGHLDSENDFMTYSNHEIIL